LGLLDRLAPRQRDAASRPGLTRGEDPVFATRALRKFLITLTSREAPTLLDLGPVVGSNVSFFGEQLGCKILIEDIYGDVDRHVREDRLNELPAFLSRRFKQAEASVDGILCWDVIDYMDKPAAQALAEQLTRVLRPDGALLAFFSTAQAKETRFDKYIVVDEGNLKRRRYAAARGKQAILLNRDIIRLFPGLRVTESFLLQNNLREILFRKPAYDVR
jgi:cyclopropane fatty-acyl-phospholipid synthase-like methyltransferase